MAVSLPGVGRWLGGSLQINKKKHFTSDSIKLFLINYLRHTTSFNHSDIYDGIMQPTVYSLSLS